MKRSNSIVGSAVIAFIGCLHLQAQITGEIRGAVSDPSGAAVPMAIVKLTSIETQQIRTQTVGSAGEFSFDLLGIGKYEVQAEAPGFSIEKTQAEVKTGETTAVAFTLKVGQLSETVTVAEAVAQIDTENAQLQTSVTDQAIQEIPVGRNANNFALMAPGVAPVSANNSFLGSASFNANGGRGRGNNILVDGITSTDVSTTGTGGVTGPLNFSSIKEVKIITNNFNAEYGRNSSSQVLYITKGGTNSLHGELYEYLENDKLNARAFFDRSGSANIVRQNTYGFEVGGPVYIPKLFDGRNKAFWHVDYEGFKKRGTGAPVIANVPTPALLGTITDPTSLALAQQYKLPSSPSGTLPESAPNTSDTYEVAMRGDFIIGKKDTMWMRYGVYDSNTFSSGNYFISSNLPALARAASTIRARRRWRKRTCSNATVNEFRFGFGQSKPSFPIQTPYPLGPADHFFGWLGNRPRRIEHSSAGPGTANLSIYATTSRDRGTHNIKMGFEWYHLEADSFFDSNVAVDADASRISPRLPRGSPAHTRRTSAIRRAKSRVRTRSLSSRTTGRYGKLTLILGLGWNSRAGRPS